MKYKLVIFDLDGTILDTLEDLANGVNYALQAHGMKTRTIDEVRCFVGNGIANLISRAVEPGTPQEKEKQVYDTFTSYYKEHCADCTRPYEGILELMKSLHEAGLLTAVVSNKGDFAVQILCEDYFPGLLDFAVGERKNIRRKPAPDSVLAVLEKFGTKPQEAVYIGDSDVDIETAKNAGLEEIAVSWGFRSEEFLKEHGAVTIVHTVKELERKLLSERE